MQQNFEGQPPAAGIYTPSGIYDMCLQAVNGQKPVVGQATVRGTVRQIRTEDNYAVAELADTDGRTSLNLYFARGRASWDILPLLLDGMQVSVTGRLYWTCRGKSVTLNMDPSAVDAGEDAMDRLADHSSHYATCLHTKKEAGYKNLHAVFRRIAAEKRAPHIILVRPKTETAEADILSGLGECASQMQFTRVIQCNFQISTDIATALRQADEAEGDIIAFSRGGGTGLQTLDEPPVLQALASLTKPCIAALGHDKDHLLAESLADRACSVPYALGETLRRHWQSVSEFETLKERLANAQRRVREVEDDLTRKQAAQNDRPKGDYRGRTPYGQPYRSGDGHTPTFYGLPGTGHKFVRYAIYLLTLMGLAQVIFFFA